MDGDTRVPYVLYEQEHSFHFNASLQSCYKQREIYVLRHFTLFFKKK